MTTPLASRNARMFRFDGRTYVKGCLGGGNAGLTETARMHATTLRTRQIINTIPTSWISLALGRTDWFADMFAELLAHVGTVRDPVGTGLGTVGKTRGTVGTAS